MIERDHGNAASQNIRILPILATRPELAGHVKHLGAPIYEGFGVSRLGTIIDAQWKIWIEIGLRRAFHGTVITGISKRG